VWSSTLLHIISELLANDVHPTLTCLGCMSEWSHFLLPAIHHNHNHNHCRHRRLWLWSSLFIWPIGQPFLNTLWGWGWGHSVSSSSCMSIYQSVSQSPYIDFQLFVHNFSWLMFESFLIALSYPVLN
jgi:hypothetical protein